MLWVIRCLRQYRRVARVAPTRRFIAHFSHATLPSTLLGGRYERRDHRLFAAISENRGHYGLVCVTGSWPGDFAERPTNTR